MKVHKSLTQARIIEAVELANRTTDNPGFCIVCGEDADGCEPDADRYECDSCGANAVYGAEQLLMMVY